MFLGRPCSPAHVAATSLLVSFSPEKIGNCASPGPPQRLDRVARVLESRHLPPLLMINAHSIAIAIAIAIPSQDGPSDFARGVERIESPVAESQ